ncbi:MAG: hypothetical protein AAB354_10745 [candidate division KSB1 bacterium]
MALLLSPETYQRLQKRLGEEETRDIVQALDEALESSNKKTDEALQRIENKADFLFTQKKFELKDELTKELATKADVVRLEGEIQNMKVVLDRKFTIMFITLLFSNIFLNQNALKFIAQLLGLIKP